MLSSALSDDLPCGATGAQRAGPWICDNVRGARAVGGRLPDGVCARQSPLASDRSHAARLGNRLGEPSAQGLHVGA